jgi:hypothetical protein
MDHVVFLSRIREEWDRAGDDTESAARGLGGTDRGRGVLRSRLRPDPVDPAPGTPDLRSSRPTGAFAAGGTRGHGEGALPRYFDEPREPAERVRGAESAHTLW